jgi:hypothetical protein
MFTGSDQNTAMALRKGLRHQLVFSLTIAVLCVAFSSMHTVLAEVLIHLLANSRKGNVAKRRHESDRLGRSCNGTGQRCLRATF